MSEPIRVDREVMILGATAEAGWAAHELLKLGYTVRQAAPGAIAGNGHAADERFQAHEHCRLLGLEGHVGRFTARFERAGAPVEISAAAIVVAVGNERYLPAERYRLALGPRVLTTAQLRQQLDAPPPRAGAASAHRDQRIILLLDLGGESAKETATEALRLALDVRNRWHAEVSVFYQNLKVDTPWLDRLTREMREAGIVFCRYADPKIAVDDDGVSIAYVEGLGRADLLILPDAVRPHPDTARLAGLLKVRLGEDGYFQDVNIRHHRPGLSARRGILFAGRCHLDADEETLRQDAVQAAANVDALLGAGVLAPEEGIAHVDATKCIRCLTCVRTCPHAAVEIADYEDVTAARVADLACWGCGACVANCPVKAIELVGQALPAWMQS